MDRDGVINTRLPGDYVTRPEDFEFCEGALEAITVLGRYFDRIVVVTNQAGVGKGLMSCDDLALVHAHLRARVEDYGGRLDAIYACPNRPADQASCRKPDTGMALLAQKDFPEIVFEDSWMVGDSASDMEFGCKLGMKLAWVEGKTEDEAELKRFTVNWQGLSLRAFSEFVQQHSEIEVLKGLHLG